VRRRRPQCEELPSSPLKGPASRQRRRRGVLLVEFLLVFPILFIATLAIFEFGIVLLVHQAVVSASVEGAREAAKVGATTNKVATAVDNVLTIHRIDFDPTTTNGTDDAYLRLEYGSGVPATAERGNNTLSCTPVGTAPNANEVRVTVCVNVTDSGGESPAPDWLAPFGFSLTGSIFEISSRANVE
jgi:Flp pilus assembly protein TadG